VFADLATHPSNEIILELNLKKKLMVRCTRGEGIVLFCLYNYGNVCSRCGEIVFGELGVTKAQNTRDRQL